MTISKHISQIMILLLVATILASCTGAPKSNIRFENGSASSMHVFVNMSSDPDLIVLDLQVQLESIGLTVDLSTAEASKSVTIAENDTMTTYKNVSDSQAPYELIITYSRGGYPYKIAWRAILRDRENKKLLGTYKYDFNAGYQSAGWDNDRIIEDMINAIILPFWFA